METWCESSAENHGGGEGQLPRDSGLLAHTKDTQSFSSAFDPGENKSADFTCSHKCDFNQSSECGRANQLAQWRP